MLEFGPGVRALIEGAVAAYAADNADEAAVALKAIARGAPLAELVAHDSRGPLVEILSAMRASVREGFDCWVARHEAPECEIVRALEILEANAARELEAACATLEPAATGPETALALFIDTARRNPIFQEDLVARDIGWALAKSTFRAAEKLSAAIKGVRLLFTH